MCFSITTRPHIPKEYLSRSKPNFVQYSLMDHGDLRRRVLKACRWLGPSPGVHSHIVMRTGGFEYIDTGDAARCKRCGLEISRWTSDMEPFIIHKQRSPTCPFVISILPSQTLIITSTSNNEEPPSKRLKTASTVTNLVPNILIEVESLKQVRKRTFSHWVHRSSPSSSQMIEAGFFNCNVGDRVICIYCNIICQQWTPNSDDPYEVHKILSPKCPYVIAMLARTQASSISIINEPSTNVDPYRCQAIVSTAACNTNYIEISKRYASFATWPSENLPSVDDLVRAGFFYTGATNIVTCFYCNGSLQNWGLADNPMIEHARWFPHCAYAKQLCGTELYRKIQESKRAQQERAKSNDSSSRSGVVADNLTNGRLLIPDESTLSRLVAARLDLPISQSLLDRNFKLSIIKRCWEDQMRLKHEDFASDCDLFMACTILQKQIEHIDGKKENIIIPSVAMKTIREKEQAEAHTREQAVSGSSSITLADGNDIEMATSLTGSDTTETSIQAPTVITQKIKSAEPSSTKTSVQKPNDDTSPQNPCVLCLTEEKRLACIPCGHLATCVSCGHSLRSCPICRREIEAFVRIYI